ncbi:MAG: glycosyltransferase family 4 protein [Deltaproteobacteria bacterium]|nr:MAG: glycosyltransferase family 4 protein [Deltaproteobacteria bacterium]
MPHPLSSANMFHDLAGELLRLGHQVTIITGEPNLTTDINISKENDIKIIRVRSGNLKQISRIVRAINEIQLPRLIWKYAHKFFEQNSCDLVIYYSPTIFWSSLVRKIKAVNKCGSYLVLRDLFPQWALDAGLLRQSNPIYWYFKWNELKLYRSADIIGVQSPANLNYFLKSSLEKKYNLEVLFNWTNTHFQYESSSKFRSQFGLQDKVIFIYGGNFGIAQDVDNILRLAMSVRSEKKIFFLLIGEGSEYDRIERTIKQNNLQNIKILTAVSHDEYLKILTECDVGLITLRKDLKTQNFPGKMLGYMQLKKPMLASINPGNDFSQIVHQYNAGIACENGDDESFRKHMLELARDQELRHQMGMNAYKLLHDKFSVTSAAQQILKHFSKGYSSYNKIED